MGIESGGPDDPSKRRLLKLGLGAVAAALVGKEVLDRLGNDEGEDDSQDILTDPDKFRAFVGKYTQLAEQLAEEPERPVPYEVFLAVAIHESDSGTSELAEHAHNMFGVVAKDDWKGDVYPKRTEEEVAAADLDALKSEHPELEMVADYGDGRLRVAYNRPFRKYDSVEDSFRDFTNKVYFSDNEGAYRYDDVVAYLQSGGRDPYKVTELMSDNDHPGEAQWATGREWREGVQSHISVIQEITGNKSADTDPDGEPKLPDPETGIDVGEISFEGLDQERDKALVETMKEAFGVASLDRYKDFNAAGITDMSDNMRKKLNEVVAAEQVGDYLGPDEYYNHVYRADIDPEYFVLHLWANGNIQGLDDPSAIPTGGNSHEVNLESQILSWYRGNRMANCGYLLSDNDDGDLWRVTPGEFGGTNHVGHGIQDDKGSETHPDVGNSNAIGLEVQADTVYDVSARQFELMVYWCSKMLLDSGVLPRDIAREEADKIVERAVIGHGKAEGLEFGYKYTRPLIQAIQQFVFVAIRA